MRRRVADTWFERVTHRRRYCERRSRLCVRLRGGRGRKAVLLEWRAVRCSASRGCGAREEGGGRRRAVALSERRSGLRSCVRLNPSPPLVRTLGWNSAHLQSKQLTAILSTHTSEQLTRDQSSSVRSSQPPGNRGAKSRREEGRPMSSPAEVLRSDLPTSTSIPLIPLSRRDRALQLITFTVFVVLESAYAFTYSSCMAVTF